MVVNEDFPAPGCAKHRFQISRSCERVAVQTENQVGFSYAFTCGITVRGPLEHVFLRCAAEHEGQCLRKRIGVDDHGVLASGQEIVQHRQCAAYRISVRTDMSHDGHFPGVADQCFESFHCLRVDIYCISVHLPLSYT